VSQIGGAAAKPQGVIELLCPGMLVGKVYIRA